MFFENTQRKIIRHVFNADPKLIPTITRIYKMNAELNQGEFKSYAGILAFYSVLAVLIYHFQNFESWPVSNSILAGFFVLNIFAALALLSTMIVDFVVGNIKLKIFNKVIAIYNSNLNENGGDIYERP